MAENAVAETSMPAFVRAGMDFFAGKTVLASTLAAETEKLTQAGSRIKELEKSDAAYAAGMNSATAKILELEASVKTKDAELIKANDALTVLQANFQTASRQAQQQVAQVGANAPVVVAATKDDKKSTFTDLVAEKMAAQKVSKATAVALCVKEFPNEYAEWRKAPTQL